MLTISVSVRLVQPWAADPEAVRACGGQPLEGGHVEVVPAAEVWIRTGSEVAVGLTSGLPFPPFVLANLLKNLMFSF